MRGTQNKYLKLDLRGEGGDKEGQARKEWI